MTSPTSLIFRYHLPLSQHLSSYWLAQLDIVKKIRLNIHFALRKKEKGQQYLCKKFTVQLFWCI
jgi:hypothetical protein